MQPERKSRVERPCSGNDPGASFDTWLKRSLRQQFDDVLAEPIPDFITAVLEQDRLRRSNGEGRDNKAFDGGGNSLDRRASLAMTAVICHVPHKPSHC